MLCRGKERGLLSRTAAEQPSESTHLSHNEAFLKFLYPETINSILGMRNKKILITGIQNFAPKNKLLNKKVLY